jgi:hypothetical protein
VDELGAKRRATRLADGDLFAGRVELEHVVGDALVEVARERHDVERAVAVGVVEEPAEIDLRASWYRDRDRRLARYSESTPAILLRVT